LASLKNCKQGGGSALRYNRCFASTHATMRIHIDSVHLNGVAVITHPDLAPDERGFFLEVFRADQFEKAGLPTYFPQENHSRSRAGVIRGLHFQWDPPMGKLMRVTFGRAFLVAVDIRKGSPTLGKWFGIEASAENKIQVWAPAGFARGFCVLSDAAELQYKCTNIYNPQGESNIRWDDPDIGIDWPVKENAILSDRDRKARSFADWLRSSESEHFQYTPPAQPLLSERR
jgi:dTDP-4-dehydrorhamnose 3,5-epimerase